MMLSENQLTHAARHAYAAALSSKDPNTRVGAALVDAEGIVLLTGYNGLPKGVHDLPERMTRKAGEKYLWTAHSEQNLIAFAARKGIRVAGCAVVVTHDPCNECARLLIQAGVRAIYSLGGETSIPERQFAAARIMCQEAGVELHPAEVDGVRTFASPDEDGFDFWSGPRE